MALIFFIDIDLIDIFFCWLYMVFFYVFIAVFYFYSSLFYSLFRHMLKYFKISNKTTNIVPFAALLVLFP